MIAHSQSRATPIRVGLFGGTFNPIHRGHTQVAEDVLKQYNLDRIYFIPCFVPPHKTPAAMAAADHRLAMTHLALSDHPRLDVSDIEIQRRGRSYTIETLRWFQTDRDDAQCFFFMVGMDAFLEIHTWKAYLQLFDETAFIIMSRPQSGQPVNDFCGTIEAYTRVRIDKAYQLSNDGTILRHPVKRPLHLAPVRPVDIASSQIREMVRQGGDIGPWVDPYVAQYIETKGLYR
jgi:nicotinate-nucleotide adenylyltransferase